MSGALDWFSHRFANRLLGNDRDMATLEVTLMGPELRFEQNATFAVTGAEFHITLDGTPVEMNRAIEATSGAVLTFGARLRGARAYVGIAGGIDVPRVLGSRSTHVVTRMGGHEGRALKRGDMLRTGAERQRPGAMVPQLSPFAIDGRDGSKLRCTIVDGQLAAQLSALRFRVSTRSDRMGYLLDGATIDAAPSGELISTALPTGTIQVPPSGLPILLMNDHATTGGYAMAATVITADLPLAGQLAPGDPIEFEMCAINTAHAELRRRENALGAA